MTKDVINLTDIKKATKTLRAVNHPIRLKMLTILDKNDQLTVGEMVAQLNIWQSVCSSYLGILRKEGIVKATRTGKLRHYSLVKERVRDINTYCAYLAEFL